MQDESAKPLHYSYRRDQQEDALEARAAYISANERWQKVQNQGASADAIDRAKRDMDAAGSRWEAMCKEDLPDAVVDYRSADRTE